MLYTPQACMHMNLIGIVNRLRVYSIIDMTKVIVTFYESVITHALQSDLFMTSSTGGGTVEN